MRRLLLLFAILSLFAREMQGKTTTKTGSAAGTEKSAATKEAKPRKVRRVLFRTDSPRLFAPAQPKPVEPPVVPPRREREKPKIANVPPLPKPRTVIPIPPRPEPKLTPPEPAEPAPQRELALQPTTFTPYDRYLGTVRSVIANLDGSSPTMASACELVREGRRFRYLASDPYRAQPPSITEARQAGDCKSKALWLYGHLGDPSAFYVIGKLERRSRTSHAWVYWRHDGQWWILDPTDRATPIAADSVSSSRYVPYYSYSKAGAFRHPATSLILAMGTPAASSSALAVRSRSTATSGARASRR
jgi:hypothetical protein